MRDLDWRARSRDLDWTAWSRIWNRQHSLDTLPDLLLAAQVVARSLRQEFDPPGPRSLSPAQPCAVRDMPQREAARIGDVRWLLCRLEDILAMAIGALAYENQQKKGSENDE